MKIDKIEKIKRIKKMNFENSIWSQPISDHVKCLNFMKINRAMTVLGPMKINLDKKNHF